MRRSSAIITGIAIALLIVLSGVLYAKFQSSKNELMSVKTENEMTRTRYAEAIGSIATIQDSLNAIVLGDEQNALVPGSVQEERALSENRGDEVLAKVSVLKAGIERSKARIQELADNLEKSGVKIDGLEKMIAGLRHTVREKEAMVAQLQGQVASLETEVGGLTASNEEKRRELGTVFVAIGSKQELMNSGTVEAKGGVLGIGKTLKPTGVLNEALCTTVDTDMQTTVDIPAKKAVVLSPQPASSYIVEEAGDHVVLRILDPAEFRKVRHVVIMTTA